MHNNEIMLSIIVPYYNYVSGLRKLLKSIPVDDRIEVIVIDDGSYLECKQFAELKNETKNKNIIYWSECENGGAGRARNKGIDMANGKYVLFADCDDFFVEDAFDIIIRTLYSYNDADVIFFAPTSITIEEKPSERHEIYEKLVKSYVEDDGVLNETRLRFLFFSPCSKLIRRDLIIKRHIRFDEIKYSNDVMFSTKVGYYAKKVFAQNTSIYCIVEHEGSLTKNTCEEALMKRRKVYMRWKYFLCTHISCKKIRYIGLPYRVYVAVILEFIRIIFYEMRHGTL